jgi:uncharacterized RDD family membrane protein YckC
VLAVHGALAAQMQPAPEPASDNLEYSSGAGADMGRAVQRQLFHSSNVIPFETYAPTRGETRRRPSGKTGARRIPRTAENEQQGKLDFLPPQAPKPRTLGTTVEAVIYCELPVAFLMHRAVATLLDWSITLIAYGLFLAAYKLAGGAFYLNRENLAVFGGAFLLVGFTYTLMWAIMGCDSAGARWTGLRLVTFEGFQPEIRQRVLRCAGAALTVCSAFGLLWPLLDEEALGWRDHISRTFATLSDSEPGAYGNR